MKFKTDIKILNILTILGAIAIAISLTYVCVQYYGSVKCSDISTHTLDPLEINRWVNMYCHSLYPTNFLSTEEWDRMAELYKTFDMN